MTKDERGRWFRVYARQVRQHPKFRDLNVTQLGAWLVLRFEAELRDGACFADRADAILTLRRRKTPRPAGMLDGLVALSLFDVQEDGSIAVHDRADHDRPRYPSDEPEAIRERVRRHRETSGNEPETKSNDTHAHVQPQPQPTDSAPAPAVGGEDDESLKDAADAYYSVTGRFPHDRILEWLNRLSRLYGDELFGKVLSKVYVEDSDPRTLLGRTEERLKAIYHRQHRGEIKAEAKKLEQTMLDDIRRQEEADWQRCAECHAVRRAHRADHDFVEAAA